MMRFSIAAVCILAGFLAQSVRAQALDPPSSWIKNVVILGDSFNNAGEVRAPLARYLGISENQIWTFGRGGASISRLTVDGDPDGTQLCNAANGYPGEWCRMVRYQAMRVDGVCRSFSSANSSESTDEAYLTDTIDNSGCVGDGDPFDCCDGATSGDCAPTCTEDVYRAAGTIFVFATNVNDVRGNFGPWIDGDFDDTFEVEIYGHWSDVLDHFEGLTDPPAYLVVANSIPVLSDDAGGISDGIRRWEVMRAQSDHIKNTLMAGRPRMAYADAQQAFMDFWAKHGTERFLELYNNCTVLYGTDATGCLDGTHPGQTPGALGVSGYDVYARELADAILSLVNDRRR